MQREMLATENETKIFYQRVSTELKRAEKKFPLFPLDLIHGAAIMAEESGEAIQAALQYVYENSDRGEYAHELIQTAAMALRAWISCQRQR